mgnify:FL=1
MTGKVPEGGGLKRRVQFGHSFEEIISVEYLLLAWQEFVRGKRRKQDVQEFSLRLMDNILAIHEDLAQQRYTHGGYYAFRISDPKPRDIHKASVRDRVLHHAIYRILYPFFDRIFIADVYSCRVGKGLHKALNRFRSFAYIVSKNHARTCWVLKCDIKKFFVSVDHKALLSLLAKHIRDERILWLLQNVIESFHATPGKGLPLGNLTSQLFCNIYLNEFDHYAKQVFKARHYIRYGDDFVILSGDREWLEKLISSIRDFLRNRLELELHPGKVSIKTFASGVDFLGWVHFPDHRVLRRATRRRMLRRIQEQPLLKICKSYLGLLQHGNAAHLQEELLNLYRLGSKV